MGVDITSFAEVKTNGKWIKVDEKIFPEYNYMSSEPFGWRSYGMFGFLANVNNYSMVPSIKDVKGLPNDSEWLNDPDLDYCYDVGWACSYLTLKELLDFNYDKQFEDRRYSKEVAPNIFDGGSTCEPGKGQMVTFREFLGESFFKHKEVLQSLGKPEDVRVVFWFS